jgi:predicted amidohydrolase
MFAASIQMLPKSNDARRNIALAQTYVLEALLKEAKIISLPELFVCGKENLTSKCEAAEFAQTRDGWITEAFYQLAKDHSAYIAFGYPEIYNGKLYNAGALVGPNGLALNVRKQNLSESDFLWATSCDSIYTLCPSPYGNIGILIGEDISNKQRDSHPFLNQKMRFYQKGSPDIICHLGSSDDNKEFPNRDCMQFVESTGANLISAKYLNGAYIVDRTMKLHTNGLNRFSDCIVGAKIIG